ncbi:MAG: hypothetical protein GF346_01555 [Candidatus Eisenbacteria bacterium]|nr:hypothetical protein [Candidatus Latescibacterota bacterium]MBD3301116.1 hypothetical protein [Candidatus Eisenbacteria bacterium]
MSDIVSREEIEQFTEADRFALVRDPSGIPDEAAITSTKSRGRLKGGCR